MSLKFGIYLVEQRIVTPEQFCGLVKIQQESTRSLASLSIAHNYLTMKQVSRVLDAAENEDRQFVDIAIQKGMLERSEANHLVKLQEQSGESIRSLAVECGLLSARQSEVLFGHFQRFGSRMIEMNKRRPVSKPHAKPVSASAPQVASSNSTPTPSRAPSPKFKQHPIITIEEAQH